MFHNKNYFFYNLMVYKGLGESLYDKAAKIRTTANLKVSSDELKKLETKGEKGIDLKADIRKLANNTNETFKKYADRLKHMPHDMQFALRNHIVRFFLMAANRFDKNSVKGLNKEEFGKYHNSMIAKLNVVVNKRAPSKEVIQARIRAAMEVTEQEKKLSEKQLKMSINIKDGFNASNLDDPLRAREELFKMQTQSAKLQNEALEGYKACSKFQKSVSKYMKLSSLKRRFSSTGKSLYKNINGQYRKKVLDAKKNILKKVEKRKEDIAKQGKLINKAPEQTKKILVEFRDAVIKKLTAEQKAKGANVDSRKNNKLYQALEQKREMIARRKGALLAMKDEEISKLQKGHSYTTPKRSAQDVMKDSMKRIDTLIKTPASQLNMTPKQKKAYIAQLQKKKMILARSSQNIDKSYKSKKRVAITDYVEKTLDPALGSMNATMRQLETQKLKNGNLKERITAEFMPQIDAVDSAAKVNADVILDINLSNVQTVQSVNSSFNSTLDLKANKPGLFKIAQNLSKNPFAAYGSRGIKSFTKSVSGKLNGWGKKLQNIDTPVLGQVSYLVGQRMRRTSGMAEGAGEMVSGVLDLSADSLGAANGMMAFAGRDPKTGKWSFKTALKTRQDMDASMFAMDKWKKGEYDQAVGKISFNIASMVVGAGSGAAVKGVARAGRLGSMAKVASAAGKAGKLSKLARVRGAIGRAGQRARNAFKKPKSFRARETVNGVDISVAKTKMYGSYEIYLPGIKDQAKQILHFKGSSSGAVKIFKQAKALARKTGNPNKVASGIKEFIKNAKSKKVAPKVKPKPKPKAETFRGSETVNKVEISVASMPGSGYEIYLPGIKNISKQVIRFNGSGSRAASIFKQAKALARKTGNPNKVASGIKEFIKNAKSKKVAPKVKPKLKPKAETFRGSETVNKVEISVASIPGSGYEIYLSGIKNINKQVIRFNGSGSRAASIFKQAKALARKTGNPNKVASGIEEFIKNAKSKKVAPISVKARPAVKKPIGSRVKSKPPQHSAAANVTKPSMHKAVIIDARGVNAATGKRVPNFAKIEEIQGVNRRYKNLGFKEGSPIGIKLPNGYIQRGWTISKELKNGLVKVADKTGKVQKNPISRSEIMSANRKGPAKLTEASKFKAQVFEDAAGGVWITGKESGAGAHYAFTKLRNRITNSKIRGKKFNKAQAEALIDESNPALYRKAKLHETRQAKIANAPKPKARRVSVDKNPEVIINKDGINVLTGKKVTLSKVEPASSLTKTIKTKVVKAEPKAAPKTLTKAEKSAAHHKRRMEAADKRAGAITIGRKMTKTQLYEYLENIKTRLKAGKETTVTFPTGEVKMLDMITGKTVNYLDLVKKIKSKSPNGSKLNIVEPVAAGSVTKAGQKVVQANKASGTIGRETVKKTAARNQRLAEAAQKKGIRVKGETARSRSASGNEHLTASDLRVKKLYKEAASKVGLTGKESTQAAWHKYNSMREYFSSRGLGNLQEANRILRQNNPGLMRKIDAYKAAPASLDAVELGKLGFRRGKNIAGEKLPNGTIDYGWKIVEVDKSGNVAITNGSRIKNLTKNQVKTLNPEGPLTANDLRVTNLYKKAASKVGLTGKEGTYVALDRYNSMRKYFSSRGLGNLQEADRILRQNNPSFMKKIDAYKAKQMKKGKE